jgi:parvulin-like peptidyl-prolyl isomerase
MRRRLFILSALLTTSLATHALAQAKSLDDLVLAIVNGEEITRRHLVARLLEYQGEDALQRMTQRVLLAQAAKKANVTVSDAEADKKLDEVKAQFRSEADFRTLLTKNRLSEKQYREEVRQTLMLQKVALKENPISDEDLQQFEVRLTIAGDKATAEKWVQELNNGGNFGEIATARSQDPGTRKTAGRMRPFLKIEMVDLWKAIDSQKLKPGAYTKTPVQLPDTTWAVVKLERIVRASAASAAERDRLVALVTRERMEQWLDQARKKADIKTFPLAQGVVATVNGEPVQRDQLVSRLLEYQGDEALELMINRALLLQAAKRSGVQVTDEETKKKLAELRASYKKPEEFQAFLTRSNMSEKVFHDQVKYTLLMERVVLKESPVTEADLTRYDARMMLAPSRNAALEWINELDGGKDFGRLAEERSLDEQGRISGGRMRPFLKTEMLDVWRALDEQKVKPGTYTKTPVLLTDANWGIIKLEGVLPASELKPEERKRLTAQITDYRVTQWLAQTLSTAKSGGKISRPVPLSAAVIGK